MKFFYIVSLMLCCCLIGIICNSDYYDILGVDRRTSTKDIKKAYRKMAKKLHPDANPDDPEANDKFQRLSNAYQTLTNDEKRQIYDKYGEDGLKEHQANGGRGFGNPFESFFGNVFDTGRGRRSDEKPRGADVVVDFWVTLEEVYVGDFVEMTRQMMVKRTVPGTRSCNCRMEMQTTMVGPGRYQMSQERVCDECPNIEFVPEERVLELEIEAGMNDGYLYPFAGEGEPHEDGDSGDLKFKIRQQKHPIFQRRGYDLYTNLTLTLVEALNGYNIVLNHLDNHKVEFKSNSITAPNTVIRRPGEGLPHHDDNSKYGTLYVTIEVQFPPSDHQLSDSDRELINRVLATSPSTQPPSSSSKDTARMAQFYNGLDMLPGARRKIII